MDHKAFTAGIEPGGLTTDYEVRILVCWLLWKVERNATMGQINEALQQDGLVNYFELARAVGNLLSTGHIIETETEEREAPLALTALGAQTAKTLGSALPRNVREKSIAALTTSLKRQRMERENAVTITNTPDGYRMTMQISDVKSDLLGLSLYVPTEEMCVTMREKFLDNPAALYETILTYLAQKPDGK